MYPNYVNSSTNQFYLLPKSSPGLPLCGVTSPKDFSLSFFSTWATNGPGSFGKETSYIFVVFLGARSYNNRSANSFKLGFRDSSGTTGTCIINQSTGSCQDSTGLSYQVTDLMICEADGNPSYCAGH